MLRWSSAEENLSPGDRFSHATILERFRMRAVGAQAAAARQYVETEAKANRRDDLGRATSTH
jgi:hypothetical protein